MNKLKFMIGTSSFLVFLFFLLLSAGNTNIKNSDSDCNTLDSNVSISIENIDDGKRLRNELLESAVSNYFEKAIKAGDIVGTGVSIVHGDSEIFAEGYGLKNAFKKEKVDGETVFRLGSLSKGFTGVLAGILENKGLIDFDDKVVECIPEFQLGDDRNTSRINLSHILSHTSGTPYHSYTDLVEAGVSLNKIASMFYKVNPISEPGELYSYQNAMFAISSEMMERSSGEDFNESLKENIFKPLDMVTATTSHQELKNLENIALPHRKSRKYWKPVKLTDKYYNAVAAGGISASAKDMAKWMQLILGQKPLIADATTLSNVFDPRIEIKGSRKYYQKWPGHLSSHYAFGWRILDFMEDESKNSYTIIHHGGSVNDYRNEIAVYPEEQIGICVLINSHSKISRNVIPDLYNIVKEVMQSPSYVKTLKASADSTTVALN